MVDRNPRYVDYSSYQSRGVEKGSRAVVTSSANHIYYDVIIEHNDENNPTHAPTPAVFSETRSQPLISKPEDYFMSVVRFQVPGQFIPMFLDIGYFGGVNPNVTYNSITLSYSGTDSQVHLIYVPQDLTQPVPPPPPPPATPSPWNSLTVYGLGDYTFFNMQIYVSLTAGNVGNQPNISPANWQLTAAFTSQSLLYYAVYSYQQFVDEINVALATAFGFLPLPVLSPVLQVPYMIYDSVTNLFSIIVDQRLPGLGFQMFMNDILYGFFVPSFDVITHTYGDILGKDIEILLKNNHNNNYTPSPPVAGVSFYQMIQERPTIDNFYAVKTILFTINNVPIRSEYIPSGTTSQNKVNNNFLPIMTDFVPALTNKAGDLLSEITYYPTAEYRLIDLIGSDPLSTIDIQVYWTDNYLRIYPLLIYPHDLINIKILFRNKNYTNREVL